MKQLLLVWLIKITQKYGPHAVRVLGMKFEISEGVFNPKYYYTSKFMAEHIRVAPDDVVLDMGTGSGIQAVVAAQTASKVAAVDINPAAVHYARKNVRSNGVEGVVSVIEGDLFSPLSPQNTFTVILFTPPYMEGTPGTDFEYALYDRSKELLRRFFTDAKEYLRPEGYLQMVYSSIAEPERALEISQRLGWKHTLIAEKKTRTETFFIYKFTIR